MGQQLTTINMVTFNEAKDLMGERFPMMIRYFLEDTDMYMAEIDKALKEKNTANALSPAHTIKSSAKQLGVEKVSEAAKKIEFLCREMIESNSEEFDLLEVLYNNLQNEVNEATTKLGKIS